LRNIMCGRVRKALRSVSSEMLQPSMRVLRRHASVVWALRRYTSTDAVSSGAAMVRKRGEVVRWRLLVRAKQRILRLRAVASVVCRFFRSAH